MPAPPGREGGSRAASRRGLAVRALAISAAVVAGPDAEAVVLDWSVGYRGEYSSNAFRDPEDEQEEWTNIGTFDLAAEEAAPRWRGTFASAVEYREYTQNTFEDETVADVDTTAELDVLPQRLTWLLEDHFAQVPIDIGDPDIPDNRQNTNVVTTGPSLQLRLNRANALIADARYSDYYFEETEADSERVLGGLRLRNRRGPSLVVTGNAEMTAIDYDNDLVNVDFDRGDLYLSIDYTPPGYEATADLGATSIELDDGREASGFLGRSRFTRLVRTNLRTGVILTAEFSDTGRDLELAARAPGEAVLAGEEITGDIFYTQRAEVFFARESPVGGQGGAIYYIDRDFETAPGDESISGFRLELSRTVSPTTTATLYGDYYETDFRLIDREDRDSEVGLSLRYRVRRRLAMLAGVEWEDRRSTDPTEEFTEVTGYVGLSFGP